MKISELIRKMADNGASAEAIAIAVEALEARDQIIEANRAAARERKRKQRAAVSCDSHGTVTGQSCDIPLDKEKSPTPPKEINPPKEKTPKGVQKKSPIEVLSEVLSPKHSQAVAEHRRRMGSPLTEHAAELLAKTFAKCPAIGWTPDQAADEMISRGWQGVKLDWLQNSTPPKLEPATIGQSDDDWLRRLRFARMKLAWSANEWGPMPGQVGCKVPKHLLEPNDGKGWADQRPEPKRSVA